MRLWRASMSATELGGTTIGVDPLPLTQLDRDNDRRGDEDDCADGSGDQPEAARAWLFRLRRGG